MGSYDDIININYEGPKEHPRMDMSERAKIFLPFAALKGHEEAIADRVIRETDRKEQEIRREIVEP